MPEPPCPGETLAFGYVMCYDSTDPNRMTPVDECEVTIAGMACRDTFSFTVETDENGRYEHCVPCGQCPDDHLLVTAECCNAPPVIWPRLDCPPEEEIQPPIICDPCP